MRNLSERFQSDIWIDAIPTYDVIDNNLNLEQNTDKNSTFWDLYYSANNLMQLYHLKNTPNERQNIQPIPLKKAHTILDILNDWTEKNIHTLTYPLTKDSFESAIIKTIEDDDLKSFAVLCGSFNKHMSSIIKKYKFRDEESQYSKIKNWLDDAIKPQQENNFTNKATKQYNVNPNPTNTQKQSYSQERTDNKAEYLKKYKKSTIMESFIKDINENCINEYKEDTLCNINITDSFLKSHLRKINFSKKNNINDWVTSVFLPSLFYVEKLDKFLDSFPNWRKLNIQMRLFEQYHIDSKEILDNAPIWGFIKNFTQQYPKYEKLLIEKLLPNVISIEKLTIQEKFKFGKKILEKWCDNNEELFKQRIAIWENLGGNVFDKNYNNESLISWIRKQKNEKWNKVIDNLYPNKGFYNNPALFINDDNATINTNNSANPDDFTEIMEQSSKDFKKKSYTNR